VSSTNEFLCINSFMLFSMTFFDFFDKLLMGKLQFLPFGDFLNH